MYQKLPLLLLVLLLVWTGAPRLHARGVAPAVFQTFEEQGRVVAFVVLEHPVTTTRSIADLCRCISMSQTALLSSLPEGACRVRYRYRHVPVLLLEIGCPETLKSFEATPGVRSVNLDRRGRGALVESKAFIGAAGIEDRLGLGGADRVVAILDSGINTTHEDLGDAVIHEYFFLDQGDFGDDPLRVGDESGHGTGVAGIIASRGQSSPRGIAPAAKIVSIRVLDRFTSGWISDWTAGVDYIVGLHRADNGISIDAINMSLSSNAQFEGICDGEMVPFSEVCRLASEAGIALFSASGNIASTTEMSGPACFSTVFSVGSVHDTPPDLISTFTSRNSLLDLLAPGEEIISATLGGGTRSLRGTSFAVAHVTAVALLLRELDASLSSRHINGVLKFTGVPVSDPWSELTFPRLDAGSAMDALFKSADCDGNGVLDFIDIEIDQTLPDCNQNGQPDGCDIALGLSTDCDEGGIPDECEVASGILSDIDENGIADVCDPRPRFFRGDPNRDGHLDITDADALFNFLFLGGETPACLETADANNDGRVDIADGISLLLYLFRDGAPPPEPGPPGGTCGFDVDTPDSAGDLGCELYEPCGA